MTLFDVHPGQPQHDDAEEWMTTVVQYDVL